MSERDPALSFGKLGEFYASRPPYSERAQRRIDALVTAAFPNTERLAADIGAGGGELSRRLVGAQFVKIDPDEEMLRRGKDLDPGTPHIVAFAHELPLPSESVMLATAGTTMHWWRRGNETDIPHAALREAHRILRPGGYFVSAHLQEDGSSRKIIAEAIEADPTKPRYTDELAPVWGRLARSDSSPETAWGLFEDTTIESYQDTQSMAREAFLSWMRSFQKFNRAVAAGQAETYMRRVESAADQLATPTGEVQVSLSTTLFIARKPKSSPRGSVPRKL